MTEKESPPHCQVQGGNKAITNEMALIGDKAFGGETDRAPYGGVQNVPY